MAQQWQLQDAKNRFSEVVENAVHDGPQFITTKDKQTVVVISNKEYRKMQQPKESLVDFFQNSPLKNADLNLDRDKSTT